MKLTIPHVTLQQSLQAAKHVRSTRFEKLNLHLCANEDQVMLQTQANGMRCTVLWRVRCDGQANVLLNYDLLANAVKQGERREAWDLTCDKTGLYVQGKQVPAWQADTALIPQSLPRVGDRVAVQEEEKPRRRKTASAHAPQEAIHEITEVDVVSVDIDQAELLRAVTLAAACIIPPETPSIPQPTKKYRDYFRSLCVDLTKDVLTVVGADGYRVGLQRISVTDAGSWPVRLCIPALPFLLAVQGFPCDKHRNLTLQLSAPVLHWKIVERNGKPLKTPEQVKQPTIPYIVLSVGSALLYVIDVTAKEWPFERAIELEQTRTTLILSTRKVRNAVTALKDIADEDSNACYVRLEGDKITLSAHSEDEEGTRSFKVIVEGDPSPRDFILNAAQLRDALDQARSEEIHWLLGEPGQAVTVTPFPATRDAYHRMVPMHLVKKNAS